jgi:L-threonylcarbamoyladenylate synthase
MSAEITTDVVRAAETLRRGGLVAFATETVYGLGANALDDLAVARVFEAKGRPHFDPLIVHLAAADHIFRVASEVPPLAERLADAFWPGPLTLVLPKQPGIPDLVTSGLSSVGVRVPGHELACELIRRAGCPVAAPSANLFGRVSPTTAEHVAEQLGERIDLILDGGPCRVGIESTVIDLTGPQPALLRPGGVTREELEPVAGRICLPTAGTGPGSAEPGRPTPAPGMLPQHYAPRTPVRVVGDWGAVPANSRLAALGFRSVGDAARFQSFEVLSPTGDLREAAAKFFAALRRLDRANCDVILAEHFPETGLGVALNDRLTRAAATTTGATPYV